MQGTRAGSCASECQSESLETPDPPSNPSLPLFSSLHSLLSGGSECSGLHVLSRCAGIGENIKVKTKGSEKTPGNSAATCASIYVCGSQGARGLFAYTGVCIGEKCVRVCVCVLFAARSYACILVIVFIFISE